MARTRFFGVVVVRAFDGDTFRRVQTIDEITITSIQKKKVKLANKEKNVHTPYKEECTV